MDVLSKLLNKAADTKQIGYHPKCKKIELTHLSFADDLMILTDGNIRSVEGILEIFDEFARISGLRISMEKSTMYLAGIEAEAREAIETRFLFESGKLPVRYLGLPLVTKCLTANDYRPLLEKIRLRISSWKSRYLSYAGRLNLISSVLWSTANFWLSAFQLPKECIKEIDNLCSAFFWSGPALSSAKAKVSWEEVCKPKREGGLGLRPLQDVNDVCCLKLLWRIVSNKDSLWVKWIHMYLIKKESFWSIKRTTSLGSWMWKKLLSYREKAKPLCKVDVKNGMSTSFWFDNWSTLGCLLDITGPRGVIDLGIKLNATVASAWETRRRRRHRTVILNDIEERLEFQGKKRNNDADLFLWKGKSDTFTGDFHSQDTWNHIRKGSNRVAWYNGLWFTHATPKYALCTWLAIRNRLTTGDRMVNWNVGATHACVLCSEPMETRDHLFFKCPFASTIWTKLTKNLFKSRFSVEWQSILHYISDTKLDIIHGFLGRYVFQLTIHSLWRERNSRRHGEAPKNPSIIIRSIDKQVRARISSIRAAGDNTYVNCLQAWFGIHPH